jgi:hypothetical protein
MPPCINRLLSLVRIRAETRGGLELDTCHVRARCCGIELIPSLHQVALRAQQAYEASEIHATTGEPRLVCGDALVHSEWHDAAFVFVNCVTWPEEVLTQLGQLATAKMRPGAVLALVKRKLPEDLAEQYWKWRWGLCEMSFGECRVHFYTRKR